MLGWHPLIALKRGDAHIGLLSAQSDSFNSALPSVVERDINFKSRKPQANERLQPAS